LAVIATIADAEAVGLDAINNYLWTLSDIVHEAEWLYERLINR